MADGLETSPLLRRADGAGGRVLAHVFSVANAASDVDSNISVDGIINRAHNHATDTTGRDRDTGGYLEKQTVCPDEKQEPAGHRIDRSRGGLTTKIHHDVDSNSQPLSVTVTSGQRHDLVVLQQVLADIRAPTRR
ncbi:transposase [Brevibacterium iodinum]|uniref:transposase n=1 Tax=Brevibacterium iodinum TaxID=31943 RepID=UPI0011AF128B|nr:transposase [Brevibacterium iodinum]